MQSRRARETDIGGEGYGRFDVMSPFLVTAHLFGLSRNR